MCGKLVTCNLAVNEAQRGRDLSLKYPKHTQRQVALCWSSNRCKTRQWRKEGREITNADILKDQHVPTAIVDWKTSLTQRVCRSTLVAEAAHKVGLRLPDEGLHKHVEGQEDGDQGSFVERGVERT